MARAIAICKGGPLDGVVVSVNIDEHGNPEPLTSRQEVLGVLYVPGDKVELINEHVQQFSDGDYTMEHESAYEYVVEG